MHPTRRLIRQVLGAVAEFDRRVTVMKLRAAKERKRSQGERCEGRKPFGTFSGEGENAGQNQGTEEEAAPRQAPVASAGV